MDKYETIITSIHEKVCKMLEDNAQLQKQLQEMSQRCEGLQKQINEQNDIINTLKEQNTLLTIGNTLTEKDNPAEIKLKINRLIKTIDKSLLQLTKID